jgi:RHH-type proline utilization regulon transcriptional repressor/proline dehydrogenase/delta 1-pyrroline-5-carboxylate dehydrogenase
MHGTSSAALPPSDASAYSGARGSDAIEQKILALGKQIFQEIDRAHPPITSQRYWSDQMMAWSMKNPALKINLFRLIDVLPSLKSSRAVAEHITQYLRDVARELSPIAAWMMSPNPYSLRAKLTTWGLQFAVHQMAAQFIAGANAEVAEPRLQALRADGCAFTADVLGEFAVSEPECDAYLARYIELLDSLGAVVPNWKEAAPLVANHPGEMSPICISVKLTALYSQCSLLNFGRSVDVLSRRLAIILRKARSVGALIYLDAEDMGNNDLIYATFAHTFLSPEFRDFPLPGIVLQGYAKSSAARLEELLEVARFRKRPIAIRLVKGAYWDYETFVAMQNGWESPLFAHKETTDSNFEKLTRRMFDSYPHILPAFGSHNVRSLVHACCYAESLGLGPDTFELQMLYGMAGSIPQSFTNRGYLVRQYVPIGSPLPGMGYLIRRLLENTSNESFLRHTFFEADALESLLSKPQFRD